MEVASPKLLACAFTMHASTHFARIWPRGCESEFFSRVSRTNCLLYILAGVKISHNEAAVVQEENHYENFYYINVSYHHIFF